MRVTEASEAVCVEEKGRVVRCARVVEREWVCVIVRVTCRKGEKVYMCAGNLCV